MDRNAFEQAKVLQENRKILLRLEQDGLDVGKKREFEFRVPLPSREDCKKFRSAFHARYATPKGGIFIYANYPDGYELILSVRIRPTPERITEIEIQLLEIAKEFKSAKVYWEFKE